MKNYITMLLVFFIFSFISWNVGTVLFCLSLLPIFTIIFTKVGFLDKIKSVSRFKKILDSPSKFLIYMKYDFKNGPIYYFILSLIWVVCFFYLLKDLVSGEIGFDIPILFFSISIVTILMVFIGYIKEYDKL